MRNLHCELVNYLTTVMPLTKQQRGAPRAWLVIGLVRGPARAGSPAARLTWSLHARVSLDFYGYGASTLNIKNPDGELPAFQRDSSVFLRIVQTARGYLVLLSQRIPRAEIRRHIVHVNAHARKRVEEALGRMIDCSVFA
jgi:hypothetical protein